MLDQHQKAKDIARMVKIERWLPEEVAAYMRVSLQTVTRSVHQANINQWELTDVSIEG